MKRSWMTFWIVALATVLSARQYEDRWFYVANNLQSDADLQQVEALVQTAGDAQLNGMLFACGVEGYDNWAPKRQERLAHLREFCAAKGVEIIPLIWSIGYGTMLGRNPNYVEGLPCMDIPYVVRGNQARWRPEPNVKLENGDFEMHNGVRFALDGWTEKPGVQSFVDTEVKHGGNASVRLEQFADNPYGHGRICLKVNLQPYRRYRLRLFAKSSGLVPNYGKFMLQFYPKGLGMPSAGVRPQIQATQDWTEYTLSFYSGEFTEGNLYVGMWGGKQGQLWIDDITVESTGISDVIRRGGTPFVVKNAITGQIYEEGRDYEPVEGLKSLNIKDKESLTLKLPASSAIRDGDALLVSYFYPAVANGRQFTTCMSEAAIYEEFRRSAEAIMTALHPRKWFLSMDEIRAGGTCIACEERHTDMAHILGDCITRQCQIIHEVCPEAEIYIWSDMLDVNHNAHDHYFNCKGTYEGVWNLVPKDLIISCWYHAKREKSMAFFQQLGFRTQAAAYYDAESLDTSREWLETCNHTRGCTGIIYTTWQRKYDLMSEFGKMVQNDSAPLD